jgi:hypothetical protein
MTMKTSPNIFIISALIARERHLNNAVSLYCDSVVSETAVYEDIADIHDQLCQIIAEVHDELTDGFPLKPTLPDDNK